jgi:hypothetical protein
MTLKGHHDGAMRPDALAARQVARADLQSRLSNFLLMPTGHTMPEICGYHEAGDEQGRDLMGTLEESESTRRMWDALGKKVQLDELKLRPLSLGSADRELSQTASVQYYEDILREVEEAENPQ